MLFRSNRIDESIVFHGLTKEHIKTIIDISSRKLFDRLGHLGLVLDFDTDAKDFLADKGYDPNYGARPLRRALQNYVEDPLAEEILKGRFPEGSTIHVALNEDRNGFVFTRSGGSESEEEHSVVDDGNGDGRPE